MPGRWKQRRRESKEQAGGSGAKSLAQAGSADLFALVRSLVPPRLPTRRGRRVSVSTRTEGGRDDAPPHLHAARHKNCADLSGGEPFSGHKRDAALEHAELERIHRAKRRFSCMSASITGSGSGRLRNGKNRTPSRERPVSSARLQSAGRKHYHGAPCTHPRALTVPPPSA